MLQCPDRGDGFSISNVINAVHCMCACLRLCRIAVRICPCVQCAKGGGSIHSQLEDSYTMGGPRDEWIYTTYIHMKKEALCMIVYIILCHPVSTGSGYQGLAKSEPIAGGLAYPTRLVPINPILRGMLAVPGGYPFPVLCNTRNPCSAKKIDIENLAINIVRSGYPSIVVGCHDAWQRIDSQVRSPTEESEAK